MSYRGNHALTPTQTAENENGWFCFATIDECQHQHEMEAWPESCPLNLFKPVTKVRQILTPPWEGYIRAESTVCFALAIKQVYIGRTDRSVTETVAEHERNLWLHQPEKSGLAEHWISYGQHDDPRCFQVQVLKKTEHFLDQVVLLVESLLIHLEPSSVNRDSGMSGSVSWKPLFCRLDKTGQVLITRCECGTSGLIELWARAESILLHSACSWVTTHDEEEGDLWNHGNLGDCNE